MNEKEDFFAVREKCLAEHYVIASSLIGDMQALEQRETHVKENIDNLMRLHSGYLQGKCPVLCVYGSFPAPWQDYGLMYVGNLSDTIQSWRHIRNMLFLTGTVVIFMMSFFLFQFLNIIFRPLRQISGTSAKIASGNYGSRIPVRGKDEIFSVAHNFNLMAEQVGYQMKQLADAAQQKQQFVDNFSRELRILLTAIYGYAEYIQKALVSEGERYECTQFIMSECSRLQNMADQLLDMALLRRDEIKDGDCSVKGLFAESEKVMHVRASEKKIGLAYVLSQDYRIRGNREQLLILINNLIDNAIKASRQEDEIRICAYTEESAIVVEVEDHGTGMEREQISHIKEAFIVLIRREAALMAGRGLGLQSARGLCRFIMRNCRLFPNRVQEQL